MFYFNEFYILLFIVGIVLTGIPQLLVKSTYEKYAKVPVENNMTGMEVAKSILAQNGINNVDVVSTSGKLSDHYDPTQKVVRLSEEIYNGRSVSAFGIAAHEVGHAIQDNQGYLPMKMRAGLFPAVMTGQSLGPILIMVGILLRSFSGSPFFEQIAILGLILYASVALFQIITLPVELDASRRAVMALADGGYLLEGEEVSGSKKVLTAAAFTYIAAALYSLLELAYWAWIVFGRSSRD